MAVLSTAEKLYTAYLTGQEADFYDGGTRYEFTPEGIKNYISASVTPATPVTDAVDETDIVQQFNALLASLRASGTIAS